MMKQASLFMPARIATPAITRIPMRAGLWRYRDDRVGLLAELGDNRTDIVESKLASLGLVIVTEAGLARSILTEHRDSFKKGPAMSRHALPLLGNGLLTSTGDEHRRQRKILAPRFTPRHVGAYAMTMAELTEAMLGRWRAGRGDQPTDFGDEITALTMTIAARTMFGADVPEADIAVIAEGLEHANRWVIQESTALTHLPLWVPSARNRRMRAALAAMDAIVYRLIAEHRAGGDSGDDVLSALLAARDESGQGMDDELIRDQVMTFFMAGHETVATALGWAFHVLSQHPDVADAIAAEADAALVEGHDASSFRKLSYTRNVLNEVMRLHPPTYMIGRQATRDVVVTGKGRDYLIRRGRYVIVNTLGIHRRSDYFSDPLEFRPDATRRHERLATCRVSAVRRRSAGVHRQSLRHDGRDYRARAPVPGDSLHRHARAHRPRAAHHLAAEWWNTVFCDVEALMKHRKKRFDTDVVVVGSGFGGAVAALRFAEAGERVVVIERGDWVRRDDSPVGRDMFWNPDKNRFGVNDIRPRGERIVPWLGAGVGGGSHVFAGTLKRVTDFSAYPADIRDDDMAWYYEIAEDMLEVRPHPGYGDNRATDILLDGYAALAAREPELVESHGVVPLAIQFAERGQEPGAELDNRHGARQRTAHPHDQSILGGDIGSKNSLDHNYLHLAGRHGAEIRALTEVDRIDPMVGGGYRIHYVRWLPDSQSRESGSLTTRRLVLAAGAIGSTEILLRNRDVHGTLPRLSGTLGERYTTNGNYLNLILPVRGVAVAWLGFIALVVGLIASSPILAIAGALAYYLQLWLSRPPCEPDLGTTNSDYISFRGRDGVSGGGHIESGRYPTPVRLAMTAILSLVGQYRPSRYRWVVWASRVLCWLPPLGALARSWPIPLLQMGRDDATGAMQLDDDGRVTIDFQYEQNRGYYEYLDDMGKRVARSCKAIWLPNIVHRLTGKLEVPHNQGGAPIGADARVGVVDHAGRVFGYDDMMVLDGSIIPASPGPNPALTILALAERGMDIAVAQLHGGGTISTEQPVVLARSA